MKKERKNYMWMPIVIDKTKKCFVQNGEEYPFTKYNLEIYKRNFDGIDNLNELLDGK